MKLNYKNINYKNVIFFLIFFISLFIILIILTFTFMMLSKINKQYTAIIVEPRKHKALEYVLNNYLENLDDNWNIILFHGVNNKEYCEDIINRLQKKYNNRIKTINLKIENLSIFEYSALLLDKKFYDNIPTEIFLVFQTDTIICSKFKHFINDFIKYDYVGAPWPDGHVGNGGLSLRRKSKVLEMLDKCPPKDDVQRYYEDAYFSFPCDKMDYNKPSFEEAKNFSIEKIMNDKSFGIHKAYAYHGNEEIKKWCPEIEKLSVLQSTEE